MACHHICTRDEVTGERFCPWARGWVEACPQDAWDDPNGGDREDD